MRDGDAIRRLDRVVLRRAVAASLLHWRSSLELLLEGRLWLFAGADASLVLFTVVMSLAAGGRPVDIYRGVLVLPLLFVGLPLLSNLVAVERRSGTLDLALAAPSTERYFVRRALPVVVVLFAQGAVLLGLLAEARALSFLRALVLGAATCALAGAVSLFWAVRLRTAGATLLASLATVLLFAEAVFSDPMPPSFPPPDAFLSVPVPVLEWLGRVLVLGAATVLFYLYARRRLRRPETLL